MVVKITYEELRRKVQEIEKYPNCSRRSRAPLIHKGFPSSFNVSFTEFDMMNEFGDFSSYNHDLVFSTIQSCIRLQDIFDKIDEGKEVWKYLGVFEMADIGGQIILSDRNKTKECHVQQLNKLVDFLVSLGLKKDRIYPSYCKGGSVNELTSGKYKFDFFVPEDTLTKNAFIEAGLPESNIISDKSRDTFLSLHIDQKSPWGYRSEINYNIGTKEDPRFIDIATLEYCLWFPVYDGREVARNIVGLEETEHTISVGGIGVERLCLVVNGLNSVQEVDYIAKFYDVFKKIAPYIPEERMIKAGEALRSLHRIESDRKSFGLRITKQRKKRRNRLIRILEENAEEILTKEKLTLLLKVHAEVQSWHNNLKKSVDFTISEILEHYSSPQEVRWRFKKLKREVFYESNEEQSSVGELVRNLPSLFPAMPRAKHYSGTEGLKKVADIILQEKNSEVDIIFSSELIKFVPEYSKYFRSKRIERGITIRALVDKSEEMSKLRARDCEELREIRFLKNVTECLDSAVYIFGNKIAIITASRKERGGIIIENKELAKIQKHIFEKLWTDSKASNHQEQTI